MEGGGAIGKINQREGGEDLSTLYRLVQITSVYSKFTLKLQVVFDHPL